MMSRSHVLLLAGLALPPEAPPSLVGRWIAPDTRSGTGTQVLELRRDGSLILYDATAFEGPYRLEGDTLTADDSGEGGTPPRVTRIRVAENVLHEWVSGPTLQWERVEPGRAGDSPIAGVWRMTLPGTAESYVVYSRNGLARVRGWQGWSRVGRYDAKAGSVSFDVRPGQTRGGKGRFVLRGRKLHLTSSDTGATQVYDWDDADLGGELGRGRWLRGGGDGRVFLELRPDGTLAEAAGFASDYRYQLRGEVLETFPLEGRAGTPERWRVSFEGSTLYQASEETELRFLRASARDPGDAPILGEWLLVPADAWRSAPAPWTPSLMRYIYTREGVRKVRHPFHPRRGTYDVARGTLAVECRDASKPACSLQHRFRLHDSVLRVADAEGRVGDFVRDARW